MAGQQQHRQYTTWIDFYTKFLHENDRDDVIMFDIYDSNVDEYLGSEERYLNCVLEHPQLNFILVPSSPKGHVDCIHQCSVYEDEGSGSQVIIGVHGSRFASPWRTLPSDKAYQPMRIPTPFWTCQKTRLAY